MGRFLAIVRDRFLHESSACLLHLPSTLDDVGHLKAETRPGLFPFTPSVDAYDGSRDFAFTDHLALANKLCPQAAAIEIHSALHVRGPDDVLGPIDFHRSMISGHCGG